ncbi:hypothetical protein BDV25DRAFT_160914 [Aspergillus avenaceus]|uniref:Uncharacterized protein n=1 Tax=Aspergillus avenaceus TaxID=36643 RepID=A0A5N6TM61_ASPAV|nr:hypothetical protein BDV25DRAFT_160914 [Aspergillus avenaceus]
MGVQAPNTGLNMLVSQGWNSGPDTRGSLDILWTCLSTLALCVWTAIHPNIPLSYTFWPTFLERVGLMVIAIMFPEVILTSAWGQEIRAENLLVEVNRLLGHSGRGLEVCCRIYDSW